MSSDSPPIAASRPDALPPPDPPGVFQLFVAFATMSLAGFGGVLVFARRAIVDKHRWMTADEFNETFALCHFLPGPNIVNLSVVFGARIRGVAGSIAAFSGLLGPPFLIVTALAAVYVHYGDIPVLRRILNGVSCAAVGLLLAVVWRMMMPLLKRRDPITITTLVAVFVAVGVVRWPLPQVLLAAMPLSILATWLARRRVAVR